MMSGNYTSIDNQNVGGSVPVYCFSLARSDFTYLVILLYADSWICWCRYCCRQSPIRRRMLPSNLLVIFIFHLFFFSSHGNSMVLMYSLHDDIVSRFQSSDISAFRSSGENIRCRTTSSWCRWYFSHLLSFKYVIEVCLTILRYALNGMLELLLSFVI